MAVDSLLHLMAIRDATAERCPCGACFVAEKESVLAVPKWISENKPSGFVMLVRTYRPEGIVLDALLHNSYNVIPAGIIYENIAALFPCFAGCTHQDVIRLFLLRRIRDVILGK